MVNRRDFMQNTALMSLAPWIPAFLPQSIKAEQARKDDRILVVVQLDGGNDGLNTVIPFNDDNYAKHRSELKIATNDVKKLNDSIGLNPGMRDAAELFQDGRLTIIQGVGYPNPNRSHFESMATWHHGRPEAADHEDGWLGRAVMTDAPRESAMADSVYLGDEAIPVALRGRRANAVSLDRESDMTLLNPAGRLPVVAESNDVSAFVSRTVDQSFSAARKLDQSTKQKSDAVYPSTDLGRHLQLTSRLIKMDVGTRVYYTSQSGYDTHSFQKETHRRLLSEFSSALKAFLNDMKESKLDDRVVVLAFSEFGRRVQENSSVGTDHGAAGPVFLAGAPLRGGLIGDHPSLTDLDEGDLKMSIDFRRVYSTVLTNWLGIASAPILAGTFEPIDLFKA